MTAQTAARQAPAPHTPPLPHAKPQSIGLSVQALQRMSDTFRREIDKGTIPGATIMVARRGQIGWFDALGKQSPTGSAATAKDTIFRIFSMTKPIVSVGVMMLLEEGHLLLDEPIAKFIPEFANQKVGVENNGDLDLVPLKRPITIQDLLRHTSGITYEHTGDGLVQKLYQQSRLRSRKIGTLQAPVLFEAPVANDLVSTFVSAASGGSLYRKASFLVDALGKTVFSPIVTLVERPHVPRGQASSWYDDEGVATRDRDVVRDGVLRGYFLGSYSARKLGMKTTGSAGGNHNLVLQGGDLDLPGLIRKMGRGLLVTELIGFGVNLVTGDYSRGAAGFWVEGGEIRHPVEEITIAGNLRDMFRSIAAIGSDALTRGSRTTGSILIEGMTVAGN